MGWSNKRLRQIKKEKKLTWWEHRFLEQADPLTFALTIFGGFLFVAGVWSHDVPWMSAGIALVAIGHVFAYLDE